LPLVIHYIKTTKTALPTARTKIGQVSDKLTAIIYPIYLVELCRGSTSILKKQPLLNTAKHNNNIAMVIILLVIPASNMLASFPPESV